MSENIETQVIKATQELPRGTKKFALVLAIIIFVGAIVVASSYEKLIAPLTQSPEKKRSLELTQFDTNLNFLSYIELSSNLNEVPMGSIDTTERIVPEKHALERSSDELIVHQNLILQVTPSKIIARDFSGSKVWDLQVEGGAITRTKIIENTLYIGATNQLPDNPVCPIPIFRANLITVSKNCGEIFMNSDAIARKLYSIISVDASTGAVEKNVTVLGGNEDTKIHLGEDNFYFLQNVKTQNASVLYNFLTQHATTFLPAEVITKIQKLESYDISDAARIVELEKYIKDYYNSLPGANQEEFFNKYSSELSKYLNESAAFLGNTLVSEFSTDLALKNTTVIDGYAVENTHDANGSLFVLTSTTDGPTEHLTSSTLYKIGDGAITKLTLNYFPDLISFGGGWGHTSKDDVISAINLESFTQMETDIEGEYDIYPLDDTFVVVSPQGSTTSAVLYGDTESSIELPSAWSQIRNNLSSSSYSSDTLYISGASSGYLVSNNPFTLSQVVSLENATSSYMSGNSLYIWAGSLYIIDKEDGTVTEDVNVLY
jgi:hypothetical protein